MESANNQRDQMASTKRRIDPPASFIPIIRGALGRCPVLPWVGLYLEKDNVARVNKQPLQILDAIVRRNPLRTLPMIYTGDTIWGAAQTHSASFPESIIQMGAPLTRSATSLITKESDSIRPL